MSPLLRLVGLMILPGAFAYAGDRVPPCRLDDSLNEPVAQVVMRAASVFSALSKPLPFESINVNPRSPSPKSKALELYVVRDAVRGGVNSQGCAKGSPRSGSPPDDLSVRGGCLVLAVDSPEIRCSSAALRIFSAARGGSNPALLYVLSHELAHIYQRRAGEYAGRVERLRLDRDPSETIEDLRAGCDPVLIRREEEADAVAVQVLTRLLDSPPYREPVLSRRGSMYWNIDQLAVASDAWMKANVDAADDAQLHPSFEQTQFPTPPEVVARNARRFVCDALARKNGAIFFPVRAATHPPIEQRLRRVAEALEPIAKTLPGSGDGDDFHSIARLQQDLGPIFSQIYRESGIYLEAIQSAICTIVNSDDPSSACDR